MANQTRRHLCHGTSKEQLKSLLSSLIALMIMSTCVANLVAARHIPLAYHEDDPIIMKRQDSDDDYDMDSNASSPYQNQDDGTNNARATDGYEDNEPDGPYEETPREQEGQADLERFFDDHLGASEREGMDKENLPTNLVAQSVKPPQIYSDEQYLGSQPSKQVADPVVYSHVLPTIQTKYFQLPDRKLIITSQITQHNARPTSSSPNGQQYRKPLPSRVEMEILVSKQPSEKSIDQGKNSGQTLARESQDAKGSDVVATENDDFDRVYITNEANKPFKIEALGGYDPEEDFIDASRDIEDSIRFNPSGRRRGETPPASSHQGLEQQPQTTKDISFNDPEADTLFEDASETDEITFGQDDPYQTDLEAEMRHQAYDKIGKFNVDPSAEELTPSVDTNRDTQSPEATTHGNRRKERDDDDEGGWVNDGVEDMDIPSQSHQNSVLEKAARRDDELVRRNAEAEADVAAAATAGKSQPTDNEAQEEEQDKESESQRMPNADYMKDALNEPDDSGYRAR